MDSLPDAEFMGGLTGGSLALAGGDANRDGRADLLMTEASWLPEVPERRLAIYFGSSPIDTTADIEIWGPPGYGETVTWIGDMTGDGWPEFAVSNPQAAGGRGEIYIYTMGEVGTEDRPIAGRDLTLRVIPNPTRGLAWIGLSGTVGPGATVGIYDLEGRLVRMLTGDEGQTGSALWWDGRDVQGVAVPPGVYLTRLQGEHGRPVAPIVVLR